MLESAKLTRVSFADRSSSFESAGMLQQEIALRRKITQERTRLVNKYYNGTLEWECGKCTFVNKNCIKSCQVCDEINLALQKEDRLSG